VSRLLLFVPYALRGASRPRATRRGKHAAVYMPEEHRAAESDLAERLRAAAEAQEWARVPRPGIVALTLRLYVARPKRETGRQWPDDPYPCGGKPDADNVAKLAMDAGTKAGLWDDDTQVAALMVERWRSAKSAGPTSIIVVERLRTGCPGDPE
jgi:Holliday junction resolvase RusA-like endonuclease